MVTVDRKEKEKFETIDSDWWNQKGPVGALHAFAPVRIDYILRTIERFSNQLNYKKRDGAYNLGPLEGLKILDIGCGGGILAEPITRLGASVTGIDITSSAIKTAIFHAEKMMLEINYQCMSAEKLASTGAKFDVIYASEVIEHVVERKLFIKAISDMLNPNGVVIITTINRTLRSLIFAKFALEYIVHLIPKGTHDPRKFVRPDELWSEFASEGIILDDMVGFAPSPFGDFSMVGTLAINYAASGGFKKEKKLDNLQCPSAQGATKA